MCNKCDNRKQMQLNFRCANGRKQIESQNKALNYAIVFAIDEEYCTQGWCYW